MSLSLLGMVIIGGIGSTSGALLGAIAIRLLEKVKLYYRLRPFSY